MDIYIIIKVAVIMMITFIFNSCVILELINQQPFNQIRSCTIGGASAIVTCAVQEPIG